MSSSPSSKTATNSQPGRILLLQLKRIGDFILTAPAVAALRARYAEAEIVAVVPEAMVNLAACMPGLSRVLAYRSNRPNLAVWSSLLLGEWDACFDFTGTDRSALMTWISGAKDRHGYARYANKGWKTKVYTLLCDASVRELHTVDFHLALTATHAPYVTALPPSQVFLVPKNDSVPSISKAYAVVHIGTAREEKFWPAERWLSVIKHLVGGHRLRIILTGTDAGLERPHLDKLRALLISTRISHSRETDDDSTVLDLSGSISLAATAQVIAQSTLAMGVDSMAMHLAAMLGKPEIVLFGPTNPYHWRPRHDKAIVIAASADGPMTSFNPRAKGAAMALITEQQVIEAANSLLNDTLTDRP